jgi:hypothetical protein
VIIASVLRRQEEAARISAAGRIDPGGVADGLEIATAGIPDFGAVCEQALKVARRKFSDLEQWRQALRKEISELDPIYQGKVLRVVMADDFEDLAERRRSAPSAEIVDRWGQTLSVVFAGFGNPMFSVACGQALGAATAGIVDPKLRGQVLKVPIAKLAKLDSAATLGDRLRLATADITDLEHCELVLEAIFAGTGDERAEEATAKALQNRKEAAEMAAEVRKLFAQGNLAA